MQNTVRCPSCQAILVVPPVPPAGDFSCPRCLARAALSGPVLASNPAGSSAAVTESAPRPVGPESVRQGHVIRRPDSPDLQSKGDIPVASIVIGVLIGLCILGIVTVVWQPANLDKLAQFLGGRNPRPGFVFPQGESPYSLAEGVAGVLCLFGILGILVVVPLVVWLVRQLTRKAQSEEGPSLGMRIAIFFGIVWLAGFALVVLFFVNCLVSYHSYP